MHYNFISVLITNYNYSTFLTDCVESVYKQTVGKYEVIIVDDGSTDGSELIIKSIQRKYDSVKSVLIPINRGKLAALNIGIPLLNGKYTIILDADDFLEETYCERLVPLLEDDSSLAFCYSDCNLVDLNKNYIASGKSIKFDPDLIHTQSYIPECALTRTGSLKESIPFNENIKVSTKHHKWKRIITSGHAGFYIPEPLFNYRMHNRNLSGIGARILKNGEANNLNERLLSGYWGLS